MSWEHCQKRINAKESIYPQCPSERWALFAIFWPVEAYWEACLPHVHTVSKWFFQVDFLTNPIQYLSGFDKLTRFVWVNHLTWLSTPPKPCPERSTLIVLVHVNGDLCTFLYFSMLSDTPYRAQVYSQPVHVFYTKYIIGQPNSKSAPSNSFMVPPFIQGKNCYFPTCLGRFPCGIVGRKAH